MTDDPAFAPPAGPPAGSAEVDSTPAAAPLTGMIAVNGVSKYSARWWR